MRKKAISFLFIYIFISCFVSIDSVFAHTAKVEIEGTNRYKAVRLTPQIYNASNSDLSDLLIKDSKGENVPYFINAGSQKYYTDRDFYLMVPVNSYMKDNNFYFDYKLADVRSSDTIATSIEFVTTNTNFAKEVDVFGSYDNINWEYVQKDKIYSIDGKSKLVIEFLQPQKYTHYRLKLANNLEKISFKTVNLVYSVKTNEEIYFIESLEPEFSIENANKRTNIIVKGLKNLRLCDVTIDSDSMFKRTVSTPHEIKEIYNLSLNGTSYSDMTIPLNRQASQDDTYVITINNADDKPININSVAVRYYADEIVFEGNTGEAYKLEFGRNPAKKAPVYDIEQYKNEILKGEIDKVLIREITYTPEEKIPKEKDYKLIFNIVIVVITLLLGTVIVLKLKQKGT